MLNAFSCDCLTGFTGTTCMTNIDDCRPTSCENGGTCNDLIDGFSCSCFPAYSGPTCGVFLDVCNDDNPCANGGTCTSVRNPVGFVCTCAPGYTGSRCEVDVDECEANPCMTGGTCTNTRGSFTCACGVGWAGPTCEVCDRENCLACSGEAAVCVTCDTGFVPSQEGLCGELANNSCNYYPDYYDFFSCSEWL